MYLLEDVTEALSVFLDVLMTFFLARFFGTGGGGVEVTISFGFWNLE